MASGLVGTGRKYLPAGIQSRTVRPTYKNSTQHILQHGIYYNLHAKVILSHALSQNQTGFLSLIGSMQNTLPEQTDISPTMTHKKLKHVANLHVS